MRELDSDDVVDLVEDLEGEQQTAVLEALEDNDRAAVEHSLTYPEYSAGRLMQREVVMAPEHWNVGETIDFLRDQDDLPEQFYHVILVDPRLKPIGYVSLGMLMGSRREVMLKSILEETFHTIPVTRDEGDVAYAFNQYHLISAPVVDAGDRLVGVITIDDAMVVLDEEHEEDIMRLAGVGEGGLNDNIIETTKQRFPWLAVNLVTAILADYRALVDWFASNEVDIINRSLGARYDGPGDGRGTLNEIAADAVSRGILWVNSGGNNGEDRYYRHPVRLIGNRVAFGADGTDTFLELKGRVALGGMRWANDWDKPAADRTDYDLYLWESPTGDPASGTVVDSSLRNQRGGAYPIELLPDDTRPDPGSSLYLEVRWVGGDIDGDVLEILDYGGGFTAHTQAAYSAAVSIVDSADRGVIAVGAIDPATGGEIGSYSSQGPTTDGRLAPDVTAPSGFSSSVWGTFSGTSAAAAVIAGSAALLLEAGLAAGPATLGDLIRNTTLDRGDKGPDQVYGHGEFRLPAPPDPLGVDTRPARFVALDVPTRYLDTRPGAAIGPSELIGELWPGEILELPVSGVGTIPATGATAVVANLVTVAPDRWSYIQALPTRQASLGGYSNLNADGADQVRANLAIIPIGDDGSISIYSIARGHVVVDVLGWFEATAGPISAGRFVELPTAQRLLDTRTDAPVGPLESNATRSVPMPTLPTGVDATQVDSLIVTVTSTKATDPGWLQAYPAARRDVIASTSTVNVDDDSTVANTAIVPVGPAGIAVTGYFANGGSSHVVVDVIGYMTSATAPQSADGRFVPVTPNRAFDSRLNGGQVLTKTPQVIYALEQPGVVVPSDASGVVWNLAIVSAARAGWARGWALGQPEPPTSSLNWTLPGETRAAAAITAVTDGGAQFVIHDGRDEPPSPIGDLVADVFGYFT